MAVAGFKQNDNKVFEKPSEGTHPAILTGVFDLGIQFNEYKKESSHQYLFLFEVAQTMQQEGQYKGKHMIVSKRVTYSMFEKANMYKFTRTILGRDFTEQERATGFDFDIIIGNPCIIVMTKDDRNGKEVTYLSSVTPPMNGIKYFKPDQLFKGEDTPEWIKTIQAKAIPPTETPEDEEAVPF